VAYLNSHRRGWPRVVKMCVCTYWVNIDEKWRNKIGGSPILPWEGVVRIVWNGENFDRKNSKKNSKKPQAKANASLRLFLFPNPPTTTHPPPDQRYGIFRMMNRYSVNAYNARPRQGRTRVVLKSNCLKIRYICEPLLGVMQQNIKSHVLPKTRVWLECWFWFQVW
jgi:hypothetical protein